MGMPAIQLTSSQGPDLRVPFLHMVTAVTAFVILVTLLFLGHGVIFSFYFRNPLTLMATHLATLGWVTMMIMGAGYQLVPVVLEVRLFSERTAAVGYYFFTGGLVLLLAGFGTSQTALLVIGGILVVLGAYIFIYNLAETLASAGRLNWSATYLAAALAYFFVTVTLGLLLAINLQTGFLPTAALRVIAAHAVAGGMGWFTMAIIGVGYKLLPMFALVHPIPVLREKLIFWLANLGIVGTGLSALGGAGTVVLPVFVVILAAAVLLFGMDVQRIVKKRQRSRLDLTMRFSLAAVVYLVVLAVVLGLVVGARLPLPGGPVAGTMGIALLVLLGWVSTMIIGQALKIVPFLVWLTRYSDKIGKEKVPLLREMLNERLGEWTFWVYNLGVVGAVLAVFSGEPLLRAVALGIVAVASYMFAFNVLMVFRR